MNANAALDELLAHLQGPGVAAWMARLPDGSFRFQPCSDWFSEPQLEQVLARLIAAADSLGHQGLAPRRLTWIFEHARILLGLHRDGPCLAVVVENRPGLATTELNHVLETFAALQLDEFIHDPRLGMRNEHLK